LAPSAVQEYDLIAVPAATTPGWQTVAAPPTSTVRRLRHELRHFYGTLRREALTVKADTFEIMEGVRGKVTLSALRTGDERYIFDDKEIGAFPHCLYNAAYARPVCSTHVTDHLLSSLVHGL
jgi:hypothetical protein